MNAHRIEFKKVERAPNWGMSLNATCPRQDTVMRNANGESKPNLRL